MLQKFKFRFCSQLKIKLTILVIILSNNISNNMLPVRKLLLMMFIIEFLSSLNIMQDSVLGISSLVFPAIHSFFVSQLAKERFAHEKEQIATVAL